MRFVTRARLFGIVFGAVVFGIVLVAQAWLREDDDKSPVPMSSVTPGASPSARNPATTAVNAARSCARSPRTTSPYVSQNARTWGKFDAFAM